MWEDKVAIALVTFNPDKESLKRWESVFNLLGSRFYTVLVINTNKDNKTEESIEDCVDVSINNNNVNGLRGAYDAIQSECERKNIRWCVLCDQDSIIDVEYIERITENIKRPNADQVYAYCGKATDYTGSKVVAPIAKMLNDKRIAEFPINSGMLIDVKILSEHGGFCTDLVIDYIDTELWFRMRNKGYICSYDEQLCFKHSIGERGYIMGREISLNSAKRLKSRIMSLASLYKYGYVERIWWVKEMTKILVKYMAARLK